MHIEIVDVSRLHVPFVKPFAFSPKIIHAPEPRTTRLPWMIAPYQGPMVPATLHNRITRCTGKADPTWDTKFTTKFSRKPVEDAPLVTPRGAAKVITDFLDRVSEINYLVETQHKELATTRQELAANGLASLSLSEAADEDLDSANIAESHLRKTPYAPDPVYASLMERRIDWERYIFACGPLHRVYFAPTKDGTLGIVYEGTEKNAARVLEHKRALKSAWLDRFETLPTLEEIEDDRAFASHYKFPVKALMTDAQFTEFRKSQMFGTEDPDPLRTEFHAEDLRGKADLGYAGPHGALGIDDDDESFDNTQWSE